MPNAVNLNQASATAIDLLRQQIEAVLTAQGAASGTWVFVENYVAGGYNHYIWKCKGTGATVNNSWGADFYIAMIYLTASPTVLYIYPFEFWDTTAKTFFRPCATGGLATNADTSVGSTSGIAGSGLWNSPAIPVNFAVANSPSSFDSLIVVSKNVLHVIVKRSDTTNRYGGYLGLFQPLHSTANEFPLCAIANSTAFMVGGSGLAGDANSASLVRFTRHPTRVSVASATFNHTGTVQPWTARAGDDSKIDALYGKAQASKALLRMSGSTIGSAPQTYGDLRGLLYDIALIQSVVSQDWGEKLTIDSKEHWGSHIGSANANFPISGSQYSWVDSTVT